MTGYKAVLRMRSFGKVAVAALAWAAGVQMWCGSSVVAAAPMARPEGAGRVDAAGAEDYTGMPYPKGWPLKIDGMFVGTASVADLRGDGKREIVVPALINEGNFKHGYEYAIDQAGDVLPGWPVEAGLNPRFTWMSSPSVFRKDGRDSVVAITVQETVLVIAGDGTFNQLPGNPDMAGSIPLVDLNGDGTIEALAGRLASSVEGRALWTYAPDRGFTPCIGDSVGDGKLRIYHVGFGLKEGPYQPVFAYEANGRPMASTNWNKVIPQMGWHGPVMGDITGDEKMEVVIPGGPGIFAWNHDGSPLANTHGLPAPALETRPGAIIDGLLVDNVNATNASATLADLDGDGKAEIIVFDDNTRSIRAWHGDGKPFGRPTGVIALLPTNQQGVSVVSLGDDPTVMDFFCGTTWVRLKADGTKETKNMAPGNPATNRGTQPTVTDLDNDGKADVIFSTQDGRLFIYQTGLAYHAERMQWPTIRGNFQHTACWKKPAK